MQLVTVGPMDPHRFEPVISAAEYAGLLDLMDRAAGSLRGRVVWNVNSTATGGGVVELLGPLLGYSRGSGVDARWVVIAAGPAFFALTKRLHNLLHGVDSADEPLGAVQRSLYERTLAANAAQLTRLIGPRDVVILHDPQTAGLVPAVHVRGATVIWRCHVGVDRETSPVTRAWDFLRPYLRHADAVVFSRAAFVWSGLDPGKVAVIQPSIDVFSPKNADQSPEQCRAILARAGVTAGGSPAKPTFRRSDGTPGRVDRRAEMLEVQPLAFDCRVVVQVARWDRLKDPLGVLSGFARYVAPHCDAHLLLAGPATEAVADDPEGAEVFAAVARAWHELPEPVRRRVHLASLPMADVEENAAIVNALQRHADIVVQKSLAEGFGLTVAEAMWKRRAVLASRTGGIQDQIVDGESGVLLPDPRDLARFGTALLTLLRDRAGAQRIGLAAHERVRAHFLAPHHLRLYFELIERLGGERAGAGHPAIA